ncbi:MAG: adenylyltransferase/cytidyltransferase family protein [Anaerolineales bacterium]|nr:adenylyltransferase/cytidyltransferase family protein [Anaerolineales bacterium]
MSRVLYLGEFDPPTVVHDDVVQRASQRFDEIIVALWKSPLPNPLLSFEERFTLASALWASPHISVRAADGDVATMLDATGATGELVHLRGIGDWERLNVPTDHERLFLLVDAAHLPITSALVREIVRLGGDVSDFVPQKVAEAIRAKSY